MDDGTGLAEAFLGLDGFRVLTVMEGPAEMVVTIETLADWAGCSGCGVRAEAHDRLRVDIRDLLCFGRPARLVWLKRRWRCRQVDCEARTWTEQVAQVAGPGGDNGAGRDGSDPPGGRAGPSGGRGGQGVGGVLVDDHGRGHLAWDTAG